VYAELDIEAVHGAIGDGGLTKIVDVVGYARAQGRFLTANIIGTMCQDGLFGRDGDKIRLPAAAPAEVGARLGEVET
jgi:hypothetical protein